MPPAGKKKKGAPSGSSEVVWEWVDDGGAWHSYSSADAALLENEYQDKGSNAKFATKDLSFCKGTYVYHFDYKGMVQRAFAHDQIRKLACYLPK